MQAFQDYTQQPPVQELIAQDLHGNEWKFRHIYRGTIITMSLKIPNLTFESHICMYIYTHPHR